MQEKLNLAFTANWSPSISSPQSNWWPVNITFLIRWSKSKKVNWAVGLFFTIAYTSFHVPYLYLAFWHSRCCVGFSSTLESFAVRADVKQSKTNLLWCSSSRQWIQKDFHPCGFCVTYSSSHHFKRMDAHQCRFLRCYLISRSTAVDAL